MDWKFFFFFFFFFCFYGVPTTTIVHDFLSKDFEFMDLRGFLIPLAKDLGFSAWIGSFFFFFFFFFASVAFLQLLLYMIFI